MDNIQAGQTIGPYRIIQQIGQGGMATVYKAYQPAMERTVALKILPRQLADSPEFIGRFQQEARTIARLEHAYILPVHDYGTSDGYTYLAMRFIEAGTLKDRLQSGPVTSIDIGRWFTQLADALDYAHGQGVVHRDLKPSNVLLDARGNLFLTDFGIAKLLEADSRFTGTGALIGTPAYMSPEQAQGLRVDRRTDIYSLGIMLYEMVVGQLPFDADTPLAIILKHINDPLPLPSSVNPSISPAVEQVLLKALAKNPDDRFPTAAQFSAAWQAAQTATVTRRAESPRPAGDTILPAPPADAPSASISPPRQGLLARPRWAAGFTLLAVGAVLVLGLVVCGGLLAVAAFNQQRLSPQARPTQAATGTAAVAAPNGTTSATVASGTTEVAAATGTASAGGGATGAAQWRSWAAANDVIAVTLFDGQLVSGSPGGLTFWNLSDGSVAGRLTTGNGLPDPYVDALLADDATQSLWIGTGEGLAAFDGQHIKLYDKSNGLDSTTITALARTRRGLLAGTEDSGVDGGGLNLFDNGRWQSVAGFPSVNQTDTAPDQLSTHVSAILEDSKGNWWIGTTNGLGRYDGQTWERFSKSDGLPDNAITALTEADSTIWAGTSSGLAQLKGSTFVVDSATEGKFILGMFLDHSGDLWVGGYGGVGRRSAASNHWQTYDQSNFPASEVHSGLQTADGTIYLASDAGVLRFDGRTFDLWSVPNVPTRAGYGHILAGPAKNQLWLVDDSSQYTSLLDTTQAAWAPGPSLPCGNCVPLTFGPDGRLWAASDDGMWIFQGTITTHVTSEQGLPLGAARAVAFARDGSTWIGTDAGLANYVGTKVTTVFTTANAGLHDDTVDHLLAAADGSVWVATDSDLSRRLPSGQWQHYGPGNPFQDDVTVNALAQDANGAIWVATAGEGVYRFADEAWTQLLPAVGGVKLPSTEVLCVTPARDGSVWFGTARAGAARFDGSTWQAFTVAEGLINPTVHDIYVDSAGVVWFATSGGVTAYRP
jgi:ligand-binding sensor domain-containing protein/tRNA A-37 threonylcarbamoyl transferase component Bud32